MNGIRNMQITGLQRKRLIFTSIGAVVFYVCVKLLFAAIYGINTRDTFNPNMYASGLIMYTIYIRTNLAFVLAGVFYGVSSIDNIDKQSQNKIIKFSLLAKKNLLWILPCVILILWHPVYFFLPEIIDVYFPVYIRGISNYLKPPFLVILTFLLGYMIFTFLSRRDKLLYSVLWPAVYFLTSIVAIVLFQTLNGAAASQYTLPGYFAVFAVYGGIGAIFGFTFHLSFEMQQPGSWCIDCCKLIVWCIFSLTLIIYHGVVHLSDEGGIIRDSTLILMFIFGNTITTSFHKNG